jgi:hypothetical protein
MRSGKRQEMSLGVFPWVSLAEARRKATEASFDLARGINPIEARKDKTRSNFEILLKTASRQSPANGEIQSMVTNGLTP